MKQDELKKAPQAEPTEQRRAVKILNSSFLAQKRLKEYILQGHEVAKRNEPILWAGANPAWTELYWALDLYIAYPINYAALLAAKQVMPHYLEIAEREGYFRDLCRYCSKSIVGALLAPDKAKLPWGGLPRPTAVLLGCNTCDTLAKVYESFAKWNNVPCFIIERTFPSEPPQIFPIGADGQEVAEPQKIDQYRVDYYMDQLRDMILFLETHTGKRLEQNKLKQAIAYSNEMWKYVYEIDDLRRSHPCPMSPTDTFANVPVGIMFRGTKWAVEHMRGLRDEVKERVTNGIGVVEREKYRLLWVGYPIWFNPAFTSWFEQEYNAVFVWEMYHPPRNWGMMDPQNPLESLCRMCVDFFTDVSLSGQSFSEAFLPAARAPDNADGAILIKIESCKPVTAALKYCARELDRAGIPYIEINGDFVDPRDWDDNRMKMRIGEFIQTLKPRY